MLHYPTIDPVLFQLGPFQIHWYGMMYILGFASAWWLGACRARQTQRGWTQEQVADFIFYGAVGVVVGGRLGYMLFYDFSYLIAHPLSLFEIWQGGMSFHGGLIGVMLSVGYFAKRHQKTYFEVGDFIVPLVPIGLALGRLGNFINGELWGRVTHVPWAMVFPSAGPFPRHPSPLYEFFLEGVVLFIILWVYSSKLRPRGAVSGLFLLGYGMFRCFVEFFREPDAPLGFVAFDWLTMGQLLSIPMIGLGVFCLIWAYQHKDVTDV